MKHRLIKYRDSTKKTGKNILVYSVVKTSKTKILLYMILVKSCEVAGILQITLYCGKGDHAKKLGINNTDKVFRCKYTELYLLVSSC